MTWGNLQENISFSLGLHLYGSIIFPMIRVFIVLCLLVLCFSCAKDRVLDFSSSVNIGTDSTLDIITWNVQNFPKMLILDRRAI